MIMNETLTKKEQAVYDAITIIAGKYPVNPNWKYHYKKYYADLQHLPDGSYNCLYCSERVKGNMLFFQFKSKEEFKIRFAKAIIAGRRYLDR